MDAQSFHKHNAPSATTSRLHAKQAEATDDAFEAENSVDIEANFDELSHDAGNVVTLMDELDNAEDAKATANEATAKFEPAVDADASSKPNESKDALPQAAILTMTEEKRPGFNAFSSLHASAPLPRQNHQSPVEEAKPVKDNTNAIIMILLIAILIIAVAIFGVIVLSDYRRSQTETTPTATEESNKKDNEKNKKDQSYDFSGIIGDWAPASNGLSCLKIGADRKVSWYSVCGDQGKDYYSGESEVVRGQAAIDLLGITKERAARKVGVSSDEINLDDIYVLSVAPEKYVLDGAQVSKPEKINILFVHTEENEAQVYDYNFGELYVLSKKVAATD